MREIIVKKTLYLYNELPNKDAKEKAKKEYIDYVRTKKELEENLDNILALYGIEDSDLKYNITFSSSDYLIFYGSVPIDTLFENPNFDLDITKDINFKYNALDTFDYIRFGVDSNKNPYIEVAGDCSWCWADDFMKFKDACFNFYNIIAEELKKEAYSYLSEVNDNEIIDAQYEYEENGTWYHDITN